MAPKSSWNKFFPNTIFLKVNWCPWNTVIFPALTVCKDKHIFKKIQVTKIKPKKRGEKATCKYHIIRDINHYMHMVFFKFIHHVLWYLHRYHPQYYHHLVFPYFSSVKLKPHTIVKQICFPNGNVLFLSLFSLFKNWMHNVGWGCAEILPFRLYVSFVFHTVFTIIIITLLT